jgi:hypothetical protein
MAARLAAVGGLALARFTYKSEASRLSGKIIRLSLNLIWVDQVLSSRSLPAGAESRAGFVF